MLLLFGKFFCCSSIIFISGRRVAKYGDIIADKTGLGGLWVGMMLVAIATSLPELFTGVGSTLFVNSPDLTFGNIVGANSYNLLNIAVLDFLHRPGPLLSVVSSGQLLLAYVSLVPLGIASVGLFLGRLSPFFNFAHISFYSFLIAIAYVICSRLLFLFEKRKRLKKTPESEPGSHADGQVNITLPKAFLYYGIAATAIAGAGIWLAYLGNEMASSFGLAQNFVGSLFLGFTTTLPEITVSVAALRIGAKELAVANMLGSNLFNTTILFFNDVLYRKAPIFTVVSPRHIFTACVVCIMTLFVINGITRRPKAKSVFGLSGYSLGLIIVFVIGAYLNFVFNAR